MPGSCFKAEHKRMNDFFNYSIFSVNMKVLSPKIRRCGLVSKISFLVADGRRLEFSV